MKSRSWFLLQGIPTEHFAFLISGAYGTLPSLITQTFSSSNLLLQIPKRNLRWLYLLLNREDSLHQMWTPQAHGPPSISSHLPQLQPHVFILFLTQQNSLSFSQKGWDFTHLIAPFSPALLI